MILRLFALWSALLFSQTYPRWDQIRLVSGKRTEGLIVNTVEGYKTVFPSPGFAYVVGSDQAQLIGNYCSTNHQISEVPVRQPDGMYLLRIRPNPASIAVYRNGLRLFPDQYRLIWPDPNKLPDRVEVFGSTEEDKIIVDYFIGAA